MQHGETDWHLCNDSYHLFPHHRSCMWLQWPNVLERLRAKGREGVESIGRRVPEGSVQQRGLRYQGILLRKHGPVRIILVPQLLLAGRTRYRVTPDNLRLATASRT